MCIIFTEIAILGFSDYKLQEKEEIIRVAVNG